MANKSAPTEYAGDRTDYHELEANFFARLDGTHQRDSAVRRLQALGYKVTLEELKEVSA